MKLKFVLSILCALVMASAAVAAEAYHVVTTTDFLGNKFYSVMEKQKLKETQDKYKKMNTLLPKVLAEIKKELTQNPQDHQGEKFYGNKLKPLQIKASAPYPDYDKAQAKADKMQEKYDNKVIEETMGGKNKKKKKMSEAEEEKAAKEARKERDISMFADDVEKRIKEIIKDTSND